MYLIAGNECKYPRLMRERDEGNDQLEQEEEPAHRRRITRYALMYDPTRSSSLLEYRVNLYLEPRNPWPYDRIATALRSLLLLRINVALRVFANQLQRLIGEIVS